MQSPFSYPDSTYSSSYSSTSSPGTMDFFFYDTTFPMADLPEVYSITSSPYTYQAQDYQTQPFDQYPTQSATSSCGSSYSSSFTFPSEDLSLPSYPHGLGYESGPDSPAPSTSTSTSACASASACTSASKYDRPAARDIIFNPLTNALQSLQTLWLRQLRQVLHPLCRPEAPPV
jgi:hypothetical protein